MLMLQLTILRILRKSGVGLLRNYWLSKPVRSVRLCTIVLNGTIRKQQGNIEIYKLAESCGFLVVSEVDDEEQTEGYVRAFVAASEVTNDEDNNAYLTIEEIRTDEDLDRQYKEQLLNELREVKNRIKAYKEFSEVVRAIDAVMI